jgi:hypothetical protein
VDRLTPGPRRDTLITYTLPMRSMAGFSPPNIPDGNLLSVFVDDEECYKKRDGGHR